MDSLKLMFNPMRCSFILHKHDKEFKYMLPQDEFRVGPILQV